MDKPEVANPKIADAATVAEAGRITMPLQDGITIGSVRYTRAILRQLCAGDILEAQEEAERLVYGKDGSLSLVMSPARMGREALRRQVLRLIAENGESLDGPLGMVELGRLSGRDLAAIQAGIELLDSGASKTAEALGERGRACAGNCNGVANGSSSGPQNGDEL